MDKEVKTFSRIGKYVGAVRKSEWVVNYKPAKKVGT